MKQYDMMIGENRLPFLKEVGELDDVVASGPKVLESWCRNSLHAHAYAEEHSWMIALDNKLHGIGLCEIGHGDQTGVMMGPREIYQRALMLGACSIILIHNHPSGDTTPSKDDIQTTEKLVDGGKLLSIPVSEHMIIGNKYFSFKEEGYI